MIDLVRQRRLRLDGLLELAVRFAKVVQCRVEVARTFFVDPLEMLFRHLDAAFRILALGHVELRREEEVHVALLVRDRTDVECVPEGRTVLAVVQEIDADVAVLLDRFADLTHFGSIGVRAL